MCALTQHVMKRHRNCRRRTTWESENYDVDVPTVRISFYVRLFFFYMRIDYFLLSAYGLDASAHDFAIQRLCVQHLHY